MVDWLSRLGVTLRGAILSAVVGVVVGLVMIQPLAFAAETGLMVVDVSTHEDADGWWSIKTKLVGLACGFGSMVPDGGAICNTAVSVFIASEKQ